MRLCKKIALMTIFSLSGSLFADKAQNPDQLMVGAGVFNICKQRRNAQFQLEYRWDVDYHHVRPLLGFFATDKGGLYLCGGVAYDIYLGKRVVLTPSFAPGLYYKGKGKELGFPLEFRSSIELAYECKNKSRFGAQFYHISNASLGFKNPGSESLIFFWAFPIYRKSAESVR
jgi:lipid A 3-O-deacylase